MSNRRQLAKNGGPLIGVSRFFYNSRDRSKLIGAYGEVVADMCECAGIAKLYVHDGKTCGGVPIGALPCPEIEPAAPDVALESTAFNDATGELSLTLSNGVVITTNIGVHTVDTDTFVTIVDNGDGTFTGTNVDGSTLTWDAQNVVDTDTFTTIVDNGDGTLTGTNADGSTVSWDGTNATPTVDTDTFATLAGNVITFADGSTLVVPTAASSTYVRNANGSITLDDGDSSTAPFVIPVDTNSSLLATVLSGETGLSKGQWEKPETRAATAAEIDSTLGSGVEVPVAAMQALWTNRAAEGGSEGMMNPDGSIGFYSKFIINNGSNGVIITSEYNGAFHLLSNAVSAAGYALNPPDYDGQVITIWQSGQETFDYPLAVAGGIQGTLRNPANNSIVATGLVVFNSTVLRGGESMTLEGAFGRWFIRDFRHVLRKGNSWQEHEDGTYSGWGNLPYNAGAFPAFSTAPTVVEDAVNGTFIFKGGRI